MKLSMLGLAAAVALSAAPWLCAVAQEPTSRPEWVTRLLEVETEAGSACVNDFDLDACRRLEAHYDALAADTTIPAADRHALPQRRIDVFLMQVQSYAAARRWKEAVAVIDRLVPYVESHFAEGRHAHALYDNATLFSQALYVAKMAGNFPAMARAMDAVRRMSDLQSTRLGDAENRISAERYNWLTRTNAALEEIYFGHLRDEVDRLASAGDAGAKNIGSKAIEAHRRALHWAALLGAPGLPTGYGELVDENSITSLYIDMGRMKMQIGDSDGAAASYLMGVAYACNSKELGAVRGRRTGQPVDRCQRAKSGYSRTMPGDVPQSEILARAAEAFRKAPRIRTGLPQA